MFKYSLCKEFKSPIIGVCNLEDLATLSNSCFHQSLHFPLLTSIWQPKDPLLFSQNPNKIQLIWQSTLRLSSLMLVFLSSWFSTSTNTWNTTQMRATILHISSKWSAFSSWWQWDIGASAFGFFCLAPAHTASVSINSSKLSSYWCLTSSMIGTLCTILLWLCFTPNLASSFSPSSSSSMIWPPVLTTSWSTGKRKRMTLSLI